MEVLPGTPTFTSSSLLSSSSSSFGYASGSGDSLRQAFESLDAASLERSRGEDERASRRKRARGDSHHHQSSDTVGSLGPPPGQHAPLRRTTEESSPIRFLQARRVQDGAGGQGASTSRRALVGGPSLQQMRMDVKGRAELRMELIQQRQRHQPNPEDAIPSAGPEYARNFTDSDRGGPSFRAFPMSLTSVGSRADSQQEIVTGRPTEEAEDIVAENRPAPEESPKARAPAPTPPTLASRGNHLLHVAESPSSTPFRGKKRTMQWATKRDRRIARRREAPPLTRSQARSKEAEQTKSQSSSNEQISTESATTNSLDVTTAEVTDPSLGNADDDDDDNDNHNNGIAEKGRRGKRREGTVGKEKPTTRGKKRIKAAGPVLQLTYTESEALPSSQESSQTQDEASQGLVPVLHLLPEKSKGRKDAHNDRDKDAHHSDSSETEEEPVKDELQRRTAVVRGRGRARQEVQIDVGRSPRQIIASSKSIPALGGLLREKKAAKKGSRLFGGINFFLFGFWAQVKMFEKLIEKHGGCVKKAETFFADNADDQSNDDLTYLVSCTHSGQKPGPHEISRWLAQFSGSKAGQQHARARQVFMEEDMVQADWISSCIAKCLRKEDLLPTDKYLISKSI